MIAIKKAHTTEHLQGILELQALNLKDNLPDEIGRTEGFLTVQHSMELLKEMNDHLSHIIAVDGETVVGYALSMVHEMNEQLPVLQPMFETLQAITYKGQPLYLSSFYIMGQVCIAKEYRGQGLLKALYEKHRTCYASRFDYFITEVSKRNTRSLHAHLKSGFQILHEYTDDTDEWCLILWDWTTF